MSIFGGNWEQWLKEHPNWGDWASPPSVPDVRPEMPNIRERRGNGAFLNEQDRTVNEIQIGNDYLNWRDWEDPNPTPFESVLPPGTFDPSGQLPTGSTPQPVTPITQLVGGTKKFDPRQLSTALRQTTPATPTGATTGLNTGEE